MDNDWKKRLGMVYSTNSDYNFEENEREEQETLSPNKQCLYVSIDKKQRKGKIVTLIENFIGSQSDLEALAKTLKQKCGAGGSVKDGNVLIQGEKRDVIMKFLEESGHKIKAKGGK
jgi:translation initiation factor 1